MTEKNIVDLRKEKERREREQREALRAVVPQAKKQHEAAASEEPKQEVPPEPVKKSEALYTWDTLEYVEHPKQKAVWTRNTWLITLPIVVILLLGKNILGAATIAIGAFAFLVNAFRPPRKLHYAIQKKGITAGDRFYPYDSLESFWIFSEDEDKVLSLKRRATLRYAQYLPLGDADPEKIRKALKPQLSEEEHKHSAIDVFLHRIGY